mgnify:CR=1 FL=1
MSKAFELIYIPGRDKGQHYIDLLSAPEQERLKDLFIFTPVETSDKATPILKCLKTGTCFCGKYAVPRMAQLLKQNLDRTEAIEKAEEKRQKMLVKIKEYYRKKGVRWT